MRILKSAARAVAFAAGLGTAIAGMALLVPQLIPPQTGIAVPTDRYALLGLFLLYSAALIGLRAARANLETGSFLIDNIGSYLLGDMALLGAGFCEGALAIDAIIASPVNVPVALLAVPGLVSLAYGFGSGAEEKPEKSDEGISPDTGKSATRATIVYYLYYTALMVVPLSLFVILSISWFFAYYTLKAILFSGAQFGAAKFFALIPGLIVRVVPDVAPVLVAVAVVMVLVGVVTALVQWLSLAGHHDANRDLTEREVAFIGQSAAAVRAYGEAQGYTKRNYRTLAALTVAYLCLGALCVWVWVQLLFPDAAAPAVPGLILYLPPDVGPSCVLFVFVAIFLLPLPMWFAYGISPWYAEYSNWRALTSKTAQYVTLSGRLTRWVRTGRLDPYSRFDPSRFLRDGSRSETRFWIIGLVVISAATAWFWNLDRHKDVVFTEQGIDVVNYWTTEKVHFSYRDVRGVELHCSYDENSPSFSYDVSLPKDYSVDLTRRLRIGRNAAAIEAVDSKLMALHVPVAFGERKPAFRDVVPDYGKNCVCDLANEFKGKDFEAILRIFHYRQAKG